MWPRVRLLVIVAMMALAQAQPGALRELGVDTGHATIPVGEILSGGPPPQGIPALGFSGDRVGAAPASPEPEFIAQDAAADWLGAEEPVIVVTLNGESRIYPLQILIWHEIANDRLGGVPIAVTFCPLCNSALAFDRRVPLDEAGLKAIRALNPGTSPAELPDTFVEAYQAQGAGARPPVAGMEVTFGVSGLLYNSNLLMFDSATSTLWAQLVGKAVAGTLAGTRLLRYSAPIVSFAEARGAFPDAQVLSRDTGFSRPYGNNPYVGYDQADSPPFLFNGITDGRLPPKERVVTFELSGEAVAYPFSVLREAKVVNDEAGGRPVVIFWQAGTRSALDTRRIAASDDVGAVNAFHRRFDGRVLSFAWDGHAFVDEETDSRWNLLGQAVAGELEGAQLTPIVHDNTLWFAWAAFRPETRIFNGKR